MKSQIGTCVQCDCIRTVNTMYAINDESSYTIAHKRVITDDDDFLLWPSHQTISDYSIYMFPWYIYTSIDPLKAGNNIVFTRREILLFKGFLYWISNIWSPVIKIGFRKQVKVVRKSYDISNMTSWYWPFRLVSLNENIRMIGWRCRTHETSPKYFIIFVPVSSDDNFLVNTHICLKQ